MRITSVKNLAKSFSPWPTGCGRKRWKNTSAKQLVAQGNLLWRMIETIKSTSMIFWGPPGVGKTTLARIIAKQTQSHFIDFSAVQSGIREIKEVMKKAEQNRMAKEKTIVLSTRFIASTKPSRTPFCHTWKKAVLF